MTTFIIARENSAFWDWVDDNRKEHPCPSQVFEDWLEQSVFGESIELEGAEADAVARWLDGNPHQPTPVDLA